jgi:DNA phosphorothioation-associated putative methyltransferase
MSDYNQVRRERTAIVRFKHSKPVMLALSHGIIDATTSVFDYGCGRGEDIAHLDSKGIQAAGWDPHYRPDARIVPADVVNLGYVLNVIEDPLERQSTLRRAFALTTKVLVVSVRVDRTLESGIEFSDGCLTSRGSFQKLYQQSEFREYLEDTLGRRPQMAALGIAYVFKDDLLESSYLASVANRRMETSSTLTTEQFSQDPTAQEYLGRMEELGRTPLPDEFNNYSKLSERFGSHSRIERLAKRLLSREGLEEKRNKRREDILTYIAMMRLQGLKSVPFRALPPQLRADIKMVWPTYRAALQEGEGFLYQIGKSDVVRAACQNAPVGKHLPDDLYVHRSAEDQLGALLRLLVFAGKQIVGEPEYNVVKISTDGRKVSFLQYRDFDTEGHPELLHGLRVYLPRAEYSIRDYSSSLNPPILHRKETLVDSLYPNYSMFCQLTEQEVELGLLSRADIGNRNAWATLLRENGLGINGHKLYSFANPGSVSDATTS